VYICDRIPKKNRHSSQMRGKRTKEIHSAIPLAGLRGGRKVERKLRGKKEKVREREAGRQEKSTRERREIRPRKKGCDGWKRSPCPSTKGTGRDAARLSLQSPFKERILPEPLLTGDYRSGLIGKSWRFVQTCERERVFGEAKKQTHLTGVPARGGDAESGGGGKKSKLCRVRNAALEKRKEEEKGNGRGRTEATSRLLCGPSRGESITVREQRGEDPFPNVHPAKEKKSAQVWGHTPECDDRR